MSTAWIAGAYCWPQGATNKAVSLPVVSSVQMCSRFSLVKTVNWTEPEMISYISVLPGIAVTYSWSFKIVLIRVGGIVWCFKRPHMLKDKVLFFMWWLSVTNTDGGRSGMIQWVSVWSQLHSAVVHLENHRTVQYDSHTNYLCDLTLHYYLFFILCYSNISPAYPTFACV